MALSKDLETVIQIRLPFFLHQLHGFLLLLIPFLPGHIPLIAYKESYNGSRVFEIVQFEVFGIALCGILGFLLGQKKESIEKSSVFNAFQRPRDDLNVRPIA